MRSDADKTPEQGIPWAKLAGCRTDPDRTPERGVRSEDVRACASDEAVTNESAVGDTVVCDRWHLPSAERALGWAFDTTVLVTGVVVIFFAIRNGDAQNTQAHASPTPPGVPTAPQSPSESNTYSDLMTSGRLLKETPALYSCSLVADADVAIECVAKHFESESVSSEAKPARLLGGEKFSGPADENDQTTKPLVFIQSFGNSMRLAMARNACNRYRPMSEVVRCATRFLGPAKENLVAKMQLDSTFTQLARLRTSNGRGNAR